MSSAVKHHSREFTIFCTNVPTHMSEKEITDLFSAIGKIDKISFIRNKQTRQFVGYLFVDYFNKEDCERAIKTYNGQTWKNRKIVCQYADEQERLKSSERGRFQASQNEQYEPRSYSFTLDKESFFEDFNKSIQIVAPIEILLGTLFDLHIEKRDIVFELSKRMSKREWIDVEPLFEALMRRVIKRRSI